MRGQQIAQDDVRRLHCRGPLRSTARPVPGTLKITFPGRNGYGRRLVDWDANNFSPRFGFNWRPLDNNSTVVRGGFGIFFGKDGVTIGMAMTEKQGGSDVRANATTAHALGTGGTGEAYELVGHKWFTSAPMCDAFLMLGQSRGGLSCFLVPRWRPDGIVLSESEVAQIPALARQILNT